jgi:two-component system sensor histidine kinase KdpD
VAALGVIMLPLRSELSVATTALVLVVPVVVGVAIGGFATGVVVTATGFLVYDFVFIPPYYTLDVGAAQNWAALGVYAVVMVVTARVVSQMNAARSEAQVRAAEVRRLFDLSELLVRESSVPELLETIVAAVQQAFDLEGAALLLPADGHLELAASAGRPLSELELHRLSASGQLPVQLGTVRGEPAAVQAVALSASGQPIGLLALRGIPETRRGHELLGAFANHLALTLERAQLRERAVQAQLLREIDRLRRSLVGAVSHDLRTPLATIKVSTSTLLDPEASVTEGDAKELLSLIDLQATRLDRLVSNLLDMTRIQSGALELRRGPAVVAELVDEALATLGPSPDLHRVKWRATSDLPLVDVDHVLVCQVLANLIDNAIRHAPGDTPVLVSAAVGPEGWVEVTVADRGPGVPEEERASIFQMFNRREAGGRGGLGLAIAQAFIEAHGGRIWVESSVHGGARFVLTLPVSERTQVC